MLAPEILAGAGLRSQALAGSLSTRCYKVWLLKSPMKEKTCKKHAAAGVEGCARSREMLLDERDCREVHLVGSRGPARDVAKMLHYRTCVQ